MTNGDGALDQTACENLIHILRSATNDSWSSFCGIEVPPPETYEGTEAQRDWMSLILIVGKDVRISHASFFAGKELKRVQEHFGMASHAFGHAHVMKEFSNCVAGKIKTILSSFEIDTEISLPLGTIAINDLVFFRGTEVTTNFWLSKLPDGNVVHQTKHHIRNADKLREAHYSPSVDESSSISFL